jgi:hypothetical protein
MKNYRLVKTETIQKMLATFTDDTEYQEFGLSLNQLGQELQYLGLKMVREPDKLALALAKQVFCFAMFCRDNMELIQDLVGTVDYSHVSESVVKTLTEEGELEEEWD